MAWGINPYVKLLEYLHVAATIWLFDAGGVQATLTPPRKPSPPNPKPWDHPLPDFLAFAIFQNIEPYTQLALP